jgi:internalin A
MSEMALELIRKAKAEGWKRLDLGNCGIVGALPEEIGELVDLEELIISDTFRNYAEQNWTLKNRLYDIFEGSDNDGLSNQIESLPETFVRLKELRIFVAGGTSIGDFSVLDELEKLLFVDLSETYVREVSFLANSHFLESLDLSNTRIKSIQGLKQLARIRQLDLTNTKISNLDALSLNKNLSFLNLNRCHLETFEGVRNLNNIKILCLRDCGISSISFLEGCNNLNELHLQINGISDLDPISHLRSIELLDIEENAISDIRPLKNLTCIQILRIGKNPISSMDSLEGLNQIRSLDISWTLIRSLGPIRKLISEYRLIIPSKFREINNLEIEKCPLTNPPYEIAQQGNGAILEYWREQDRVGILPLKELKIFFLGNTTAGKSTLAHALIHQEYLPASNSTQGANLSQKWLIGDQTINIWDFGGQEYFHATHRLLMSDDAIYVVMADPKFNQNGYHKTPIRYADEPEPIKEELEHFPHAYWLETVQQHAHPSSAMMIWNKLDQDGCPKYGLSDADKALLEDQIQEYPLSLKAAFQAQDSTWQNKWKVFTDDLKQKIAETLQGREVIQYWPSVREAVEERSKTDIRMSWDEFKALCIADDPLRELGNIVIYLRDMCGTILYFPDHPALHQTVFINPNKINELIYAVLNRKVKKAGGRFDFAHAVEQVKVAWQHLGMASLSKISTDWNSVASELIEVMKEFEIITEVARGGGEFIAPQYLPMEEPDGLEKEKRRGKLEPAFQFRFKTFIPRHIIPRFIAKKGLFAKDETWWKFGILYEETPTATALVEVDYASRVISVSIHAPKQHQVELQEIYQLLKNLIGNCKPLELSVDGRAWVDYERFMEAMETMAPLVKDIQGNRLNIDLYRMFSDLQRPQKNQSFTLPQPTPSMQRIYISYAKEDLSYLQDLEKCLEVFRQVGEFSSWSRKHILPGGKTHDIIDSELAKADVIIMLVSPDYVNLKEEAKFEYEKALKLGNEGKCLIVPVVLRSLALWKKLPFGNYPAARDGEPLDLAPNKDQAWSEIVEWIAKILETRDEIVANSPENISTTDTRDLLIKIAEHVDQIRLSQIRMEGNIGQLLDLSKESLEEVRLVQSFVDKGKFTEDQMVEAIQVIEGLISVHLHDLGAEVKAEIAKLKSSEFDVKKRFKWTIPLIPFVLRYEMDWTDSSKTQKGWSLWKDLVQGRILT